MENGTWKKTNGNLMEELLENEGKLMENEGK